MCCHAVDIRSWLEALNSYNSSPPRSPYHVEHFKLTSCRVERYHISQQVHTQSGYCNFASVNTSRALHTCKLALVSTEYVLVEYTLASTQSTSFQMTESSQKTFQALEYSKIIFSWCSKLEIHTSLVKIVLCDTFCSQRWKHLSQGRSESSLLAKDTPWLSEAQQALFHFEHFQVFSNI